MELDRSVSPEQIRYYLDGSNYFTIKANQVDSTTWANATNHGFFLIFNVAIGGGFPAAFGAAYPNSSTVSGKPMLVDYVSVSTKSGGSTATPTPTQTPTPTVTNTGGTPSGSRNAYGTIQAEGSDGQYGTVTETTADSGGGSNVGYIANGDWLKYSGVDFGSSTPARQFSARVASGVGNGASGLVEVRLDSRSNAPIGTFALANTGGWQNWRTVPTNISYVTGKHDVYLTFTSGQANDFVNVNWFTFAR
jgi:hypothetical protein